jgi:hypothetical protein
LGGTLPETQSRYREQKRVQTYTDSYGPVRTTAHGIPLAIRHKSTSGTVQTPDFPKCKQIFAFPSCTYSFSPNFCRAFSFLHEVQKEKANIKSFGKG